MDKKTMRMLSLGLGLMVLTSCGDKSTSKSETSEEASTAETVVEASTEAVSEVQAEEKEPTAFTAKIMMRQFDPKTSSPLIIKVVDGDKESYEIAKLSPEKKTDDGVYLITISLSYSNAEVTVFAPPINADGSLYALPTKAIKPAKGQAEMVELELITKDKVTKDQIDKIVSNTKTAVEKGLKDLSTEEKNKLLETQAKNAKQADVMQGKTAKSAKKVGERQANAKPQVEAQPKEKEPAARKTIVVKTETATAGTSANTTEDDFVVVSDVPESNPKKPVVVTPEKPSVEKSKPTGNTTTTVAKDDTKDPVEKPAPSTPKVEEEAKPDKPAVTPEKPKDNPDTPVVTPKEPKDDPTPTEPEKPGESSEEPVQPEDPTKPGTSSEEPTEPEEPKTDPEEEPKEPNKVWVEPVYKTVEDFKEVPVYETRPKYKTVETCTEDQVIKHEKWEVGFYYTYDTTKKKLYNFEELQKEAQYIMDITDSGNIPDDWENDSYADTYISETIEGPLDNPDRYEWKTDCSTYETIPGTCTTTQVEDGTEEVQVGTEKKKVGEHQELVTEGHWETVEP